MELNFILHFFVMLIVPQIATQVTGRGFLLLYRPKDVSNDCVVSRKLRYDVSYGMGMSDSITLLFRNMKEIDYQCSVEIVANSEDVYLIIVIHFPNSIGENCATNKNAFTVLKKRKCLGICLLKEDRDFDSQYFIISVLSRIRFRFLSNSSINSDMDANYYQLTATAARRMPPKGCNIKNETVCVIQYDGYCFTSGVVCDGIKNCGVTDWYDERRAECLAPTELIGYAPVVAVVAVILCVLLAASHFMLRYLPMSANSFFIFNANEDNRLCIDPVFKPPDPVPTDITKSKRLSLIPVSSSSSEESNQQDNKANEDKEIEDESDSKLQVMEEMTPDSGEPDIETVPEEFVKKEEKKFRRKNTMRTMTEMLQQRLRSVTNRGRRTTNTMTEEFV